MLLYGIDNIAHALIPEPAGSDDRNVYFRDWPRNLVEFGLRVLLKRSTALAVPGGLWATPSTKRPIYPSPGTRIMITRKGVFKQPGSQTIGAALPP